MFDHLVEANGLEQVMEQQGLQLPEDLDFIKEQIAGPLNNGASQRGQEPRGPQEPQRGQVPVRRCARGGQKMLLFGAPASAADVDTRQSSRKSRS